jgi:ornithine carbamoyltransferase
MADLMTVRENLGDDVPGSRWRGWGTATTWRTPWLNAAYRLGFELRLAFPAGYEPDAAILERARGATRVIVTHDPREAVAGADVVNTDVWASMGQEEETAQRVSDFAGFRVDEELMGTASERSIFLHCLPAHRGEEVSDEVIEGPRSRVWDEAENRLHVQKAIMARVMGGVE